MDTTRAIQRAFDDRPRGNIIIFFPNGLYLVSNKIRWANAPDGTQKQKRNILQGQSRKNGGINLAAKNSTGYN